MSICHYFDESCTCNMTTLSIFCSLLTIVASCRQDNNDFRLDQSSFKVFWNVPSFQCASHKIYFEETVKKFGIFQNSEDNFRGDQIVILYDPGYFPALLEEKGSHQYFFRNGGLPQQGNLTLHLEIFKKHIDEQIPDGNFNGIGIIDFESWRPVFRQNFGTLEPYKDFSNDVERRMHPWWPRFMIEKEAKRRFEMFGRIYMEETLFYVKQLRPNATWGYYAYPYCYNMNSNKLRDCSDETRRENDRISWLFDNSDNFYPSLYMTKNTLSPKQKMQMIEGRIEEAKRITKENNNVKRPQILPYIWYRYRDVQEYLSKEDMYNTVTTIKSLGADGLIIWGSSKDVNSKEKCTLLKEYVENILGPILLSL